MACLTTLLFAMWLGVTVSTVVDLEKRIFGGEECGAKERLYHVKVISTDMDRQRFRCGGSLISRQWILTAGHCFKPGRTFTAYIGVHPGPPQVVRITEKPKIFNDGKIHDLMLLKLPGAVCLSQGDSGGGVVYRDRIYGVHVRGHPTHAFAAPATSMDLCYQPYLKWIKNTIKQP
ncbi:serine protease 1-like [Limanda limanda]|uniref:serine protease 1-like n=1 Tax=Limanda limanda TaxID=27771 RepID=UPI0029C69008|nr:serine protease 1-like [Limanda limanda]